MLLATNLGSREQELWMVSFFANSNEISRSLVGDSREHISWPSPTAPLVNEVGLKSAFDRRDMVDPGFRSRG